MSSQGSGSVRIYSGGLFAPCLFHGVCTRGHLSFSGQRGHRPTREAAFTSSRFREEEKDEVAVSCEDFQFAFTVKDSVRIARQYDLEVVTPYELERPHHPPDSYVTVSETYLKFRVRFLLHPFFVEVLEYFGLTAFQITPNG